MRVPVDWLREYVAVPEDATGEQVAAALVAVGLEEEGLHTGGVTGPLVVGRVLTKDPEPQKNGKTINWCTVDVGDANGTGEPQGIVCGAHNFDVGDLVVVILPGGVLTTPQARSRQRPQDLRARLGRHDLLRARAGHRRRPRRHPRPHPQFGDDAAPRAPRARHRRARRCSASTDETVEVNVTPDRGYCFSMRGIAREYSHSTGAAYTDPALALADAPGTDGATGSRSSCATTPRSGAATAATATSPASCAASTSRRPRPRWMAVRLTEAGMRPISLPVDVTNYVMLGLGQPLHAFDLSTLEAPIVVRRARAGERLTTLDDVDRALDPGDLLITDRAGERAVAMAGVMGGAETEVGPATRDLLVEAAHFDPVTVARSARRHKLPSEASRRFERGVDPALAAAAAQLAVDLLVEHGGGVADPAVTDVGHPAPPVPVTMHVGFPARIVGVRYAESEVVGILESIGCDVAREGDLLTVTPPTWRPDLTTGEDLVEEVARIAGYDGIPSIVPAAPGGGGLTHAQQVRRTVADVLAGQGLFEVWGAPFVGADRYAALGLDVDAEAGRTVRLANPLSDEQPLMRTRLLATMVDAAAPQRRPRHPRRRALRARPRSPPSTGHAGRPRPRRSACGRPTRPSPPSGMPCRPSRATSPSSSRGSATGPAGGVPGARPTSPTSSSWPGSSGRPSRCRWRSWPMPSPRTTRVGAPGSFAGGRVVGHVGELHPKVVAALGLPDRTVGGELDLDALTEAAEATVQARTLDTFPMAQSDVAVVVDESVPADAVRRSLHDGAGEYLESLTLFDLYRGDQVGEGRKSLAYRLTFRAPDRTLTTEEVSALRDGALAAARAAVGAEQRA